MTRDEVLNMPAGRVLDALIAEKVMGLPVMRLKDAPCPYCGDEMRFCGERSRCTTCNEWRYSPYKEYSYDIAAAWEVTEKLKDKYTFAINYTGAQWRAMFVPDRLIAPFFSVVDNFNVPDLRWTAWEDTAPLAICRVALLATL